MHAVRSYAKLRILLLTVAIEARSVVVHRHTPEISRCAESADDERSLFSVVGIDNDVKRTSFAIVLLRFACHAVTEFLIIIFRCHNAHTLAAISFDRRKSKCWRAHLASMPNIQRTRGTNVKLFVYIRMNKSKLLSMLANQWRASRRAYWNLIYIEYIGASVLRDLFRFFTGAVHLSLGKTGARTH